MILSKQGKGSKTIQKVVCSVKPERRIAGTLSKASLKLQKKLF
jgi:hypothetical protein